MTDSSFSSGFINDLLVSDNRQEYQLISITRHSRIYRTTRKGKIYILKATNPEGTEANTALLQREYQILSELDNPFIIRTYGIRNDPQIGKCLILDYVDGMPLDQFIATKPSHKVRQRIIEELLDAVGYLHTKQIVHKDLKPTNILITANGSHVKLIDFGFADSDSQSANNLGCTNRYASPEQLNGEMPDYRSDIYTLGKIIRSIEPLRYYLATLLCLCRKPSRRYRDIATLSRAINLQRTLFHALVVTALICTSALFTWHSEKGNLTSLANSDTYVIKDTTFVHDTITVTQTDPAENIINETHEWYDKAYRQFRTDLTHLEHQYKEFEALEFSIFATNMSAIKRHYQKQNPEFANQIEKDYFAQYSLLYEKHLSTSRDLPYAPQDNDTIDKALNKAYSRADSIRSCLDNNPQLVFKRIHCQ